MPLRNKTRVNSVRKDGYQSQKQQLMQEYKITKLNDYELALALSDDFKRE